MRERKFEKKADPTAIIWKCMMLSSSLQTTTKRGNIIGAQVIITSQIYLNQK